MNSKSTQVLTFEQTDSSFSSDTEEYFEINLWAELPLSLQNDDKYSDVTMKQKKNCQESFCTYCKLPRGHSLCKDYNKYKSDILSSQSFFS
eukprot:403370205